MNFTQHLHPKKIVTILTVVESLNFNLAEVQRRGHSDAEWAFRDGVSSMAHSDGHVPLRDTDCSYLRFISQNKA